MIIYIFFLGTLLIVEAGDFKPTSKIASFDLVNLKVIIANLGSYIDLA